MLLQAECRQGFPAMAGFWRELCVGQITDAVPLDEPSETLAAVLIMQNKNQK
jgi:hypothetical protein